MANFILKESIVFRSINIKTEHFIASLLGVIYLVGIIGLATPATTDLFLPLTPFNLFLSFICLLAFHRDWNRNFILFCSICFIVGFGVEVAGVKSGLIFGNYSYGKTLGTKILDVPIIIGINWILLVYLTGTVINKLKGNIIIKSLLAAVFMVFIDYFIEPVAIQFDFWSWDSATIPVQNYAGWFLTAFFLQIIYHKLSFKKENKLSPYLLSITFAFFLILFIIY
jgi:uncharacterized membrane protein